MTTEVSEAQCRPVNHKRVARVMASAWVAKPAASAATRRDDRFQARAPGVPNVLKHDFAATEPNRKWLADMTYVPTDEGWLYVVLDLYARKLVGWAMSETMLQDLTLCALEVALGLARPWPRPDASFGPWVAVRGEGLPKEAQGTRHHGVDEPQGRLLG